MSVNIQYTLSTANRMRCPHFGHKINDWSPTDWACSVAGETGEMCNLIKKLHRGDVVPLELIAFEAADIVIYLDILCQRLGIDLYDAVIEKFNRTSETVGSDIMLSRNSKII